MPHPKSPPTESALWVRRVIAYAIHSYTAFGIVCGAAATAAIIRHDFRAAYYWMTLAVLIDASDGTLARYFSIRRYLPQIDGSRLDDLVDYVNYTFVPILLICEAGWLPSPVRFWAAFPLIASLLAFVHSGAKQESAGFFRGFPSYWNIVAFYIDVWLQQYGPWPVLFVILALSVLSVLPIRFVYPNRPPCWLPLFLGGGLLWLLTILAMLHRYPAIPPWLIATSAIYPLMYTVLSFGLDVQSRRRGAGATTPTTGC